MSSRISMSVRRMLSKVHNHRTDRIQSKKMLKNYHESKYNTTRKIQTTFVVSMVGFSPSRQMTAKEKQRYEDAINEKWEIIKKCLSHDLWLTWSPALKKLLIKSVILIMTGNPVVTVIGPLMHKFYDYISDYLSKMDSSKACDQLLTERILQPLYAIVKIYNFVYEIVRAALALLMANYFGQVTPNVDTEENLGNNVDRLHATS